MTTATNAVLITQGEDEGKWQPQLWNADPTSPIGWFDTFCCCATKEEALAHAAIFAGAD